METYAVAATTPTTSAGGSSLDRMQTADFFQLLVAELQQQDPFEPTKTADMIGQVSQLRSIEQSAQLLESLQQLTQQQHTSGASELLGKYVEAVSVDANGTATLISGVVTGVRFTSDGTALLELDTGEVLRAADVARITALDQAAQTADADKSAASAKALSSPTERPGLWLTGALNL